jgi:cation transport ATPase
MYMKTAQLILKGATCPSCRLTIEKYARRLKEVSAVSMDSGTGILTITHDDGSNPAADVQDLVRKLGYEAVIRE